MSNLLKYKMIMGILNEFNSFYGEEESHKEQVPELNVHDPMYIQERIRILKEHPIRNRFRVGKGKVRMSEIDVVTCEVKKVTEVYVIGELCMNRKPQLYVKPFRCESYILFEDEAVITGGRNYIRDAHVEIEVMYKIGETYRRTWFLLERME